MAFTGFEFPFSLYRLFLSIVLLILYFFCGGFSRHWRFYGLSRYSGRVHGMGGIVNINGKWLPACYT